MDPLVVNCCHVANFLRSQQDHSWTNSVIFRLSSVCRRSNKGLTSRKYFMIVEGDYWPTAFLLSVKWRILRVWYFGVYWLEGTFCVKLIKLHKLLIESNIGLFLLGEERGSFELFSLPRRTTFFDGLDQPREQSHVFAKHSKSRVWNFNVVEDVLWIFGVLVREIASYEARNNLHRVKIDKIKAEVEGWWQSFVELLLFAHPWKHNHFTEYT